MRHLYIYIYMYGDEGGDDDDVYVFRFASVVSILLLLQWALTGNDVAIEKREKIAECE